MAKLRNTLSRVRLVYRRSSTLLKCVVLATIVLCTATVITLTAVRKQTERKKEAARQQAIAEEQIKQETLDDIANLGTVDSIKEIAFEILGLVDPDVLFFEPDAD